MDKQQLNIEIQWSPYYQVISNREELEKEYRERLPFIQGFMVIDLSEHWQIGKCIIERVVVTTAPQVSNLLVIPTFLKNIFDKKTQEAFNV